MKYDFVAVGDITVDAFISLKDAEATCDVDHENCKLCVRFGDKVPYESVTVVNGVGNAGNAAVCAQRLGVRAALLTRIGNDAWGKDCVAVYEKEGLATEYIGTDPTIPTNYHYVLQYGAERTILVKQQPYQYTLPQFDEPPLWMYLTSLGEHATDFHHEIAAYVKKNGTKLAFQPGTFQIKMGVEALKDVYEATEVFFCNKQEAQKILATSTNDMQELLKGIRNLGPKIAVVTDGPHGAWVESADGTWSMPMYPDPKPPVSRTGAGDSFSATLITMFSKGYSVPDALVRAPINSMHVVQFVGAQTGLLTQDTLETLLKDAPESYKITKVA